MNINKIKNPKFLKKLSIDDLNTLANDIRNFLLDSVSKTGGHLSSNLGVVELTIALHYVFDAPKDKILFDVGHQCYTHKILTGRASQMKQLRQFGGIAGFQKRIESEYDCFEAGHSSTALSTALGMAAARDLNKEDNCVVPVVGDASMMSGLSLEALNQIGYQKRKMIIIFNDNNMSINKNVGALNKAFTHMRNSNEYNTVKTNIKDSLKHNDFGKVAISFIHDVKDKIKNNIVDTGIFKEFGIYYLGPVDGHNIEALINVLNVAKEKDYPCVIHVVTKKGKGYKYTEDDVTGNWHGVGKFDIKTGKSLSTTPVGYKAYSKIVADCVERIMDKNKDVVAITPAMVTGSKLNALFAKYPDRCFDCGIAEDHAVSFAAGLALNKIRPFVNIYSSFAQRAYDQLNQDICRMDLPVVFGLDRSGLVGDDGETHHGVFDISFIRPLPHAIICQGKDSKETENLLYTGFLQDHPYFVRFPRGVEKYIANPRFSKIVVGSWEYTNKYNKAKCNIITYGDDVIEVSNYVTNNNLAVNVINARYIKPIDEKLLLDITKSNKPLIVYTSDIIKGGLGDEILECLNKQELKNPVYIIGIDDIFVQHGTNYQLKKQNDIGLDYLFELVEKII